MDERGNGVRFQAGVRNYFVYFSVQTHQHYHPVGAGAVHFGAKRSNVKGLSET